jgi:hypothetical protein
MKTTTAFDPDHIIQIIQCLLMQLEDTLSDGVNEDLRSDQLSTRIQGFRDKTARLRSALAKHRTAEKRKRELQKDNQRRNPPRRVP